MVGRGVWGLEGAGRGLGEDSGERSENSGAVGSRGRWDGRGIGSCQCDVCLGGDVGYCGHFVLAETYPKWAGFRERASLE